MKFTHLKVTNSNTEAENEIIKLQFIQSESFINGSIITYFAIWWSWLDSVELSFQSPGIVSSRLDWWVNFVFSPFFTSILHLHCHAHFCKWWEGMSGFGALLIPIVTSSPSGCITSNHLDRWVVRHSLETKFHHDIKSIFALLNLVLTENPFIFIGSRQVTSCNIFYRFPSETPLIYTGNTLEILLLQMHPPSILDPELTRRVSFDSIRRSLSIVHYFLFAYYRFPHVIEHHFQHPESWLEHRLKGPELLWNGISDSGHGSNSGSFILRRLNPYMSTSFAICHTFYSSYLSRILFYLAVSRKTKKFSTFSCPWTKWHVAGSLLFGPLRMRC